VRLARQRGIDRLEAPGRDELQPGSVGAPALVASRKKKMPSTPNLGSA
jgi:hypothetical protein